MPYSRIAFRAIQRLERFGHQKALTDPDLWGYANRLGLDRGRLGVDLDGQTVWQLVQVDADSALASGARGTPTRFINGRLHAAGYDESTLGAATRSRRLAPRRRAAGGSVLARGGVGGGLEPGCPCGHELDSNATPSRPPQRSASHRANASPRYLDPEVLLDRRDRSRIASEVGLGASHRGRRIEANSPLRGHGRAEC